MFNWLEKLNSRSRTLLVLLALAAAAIIGFVDYSSGYEISFDEPGKGEARGEEPAVAPATVAPRLRRCAGCAGA